jgi:hypothetical protein
LLVAELFRREDFRRLSFCDEPVAAAGEDITAMLFVENSTPEDTGDEDTELILEDLTFVCK